MARTRYAQDCATIDGYEHHIAYVTPDGRWRFPTDLGVDALAAAVPMAPADGIAHVVGLGVDVMVPHMFCVPGTTTYRAQFDVPGIPYVGSTPAVTANKAWAKAIVAAAGVDVPPGELLRPGDRPTLAPPAVVKPADADNSLGVALVRSREDYGPALTEAFTHSRPRSSSGTSSWAGRCGAASSSGTGGWSASRSRSAPSTTSGTTPTRSTGPPTVA